MSNTQHLLWIAREFGDPDYTPLSITDLEALEFVTTFESFGSGARLFREGDQADSCFLIQSGQVRLIRDGGQPSINLAQVGEGQIIGDYAMFRKTSHASTAKAMSAVTAVEMPREQIMDTLAMRPRIGLRWLIEALGRVEMAHQRMSVILRGSVESRVAAYLLAQTGDGEIDITHEALAEMVAVERASASRAIGKLREQGAITNSRGSMKILDRDRLAEIQHS